MRRQPGFTLLELLIVLGIVSILAAMLFPVFARARESARKIECLSHVVQLGTALQMYAADWSGVLPPKDNDWAPLDQYMKNVDVLHCPMDPNPVVYAGDLAPSAPRARLGAGAPAGGRVVIPYSSYIYRSGLTNDGRAMEVVAFDREIWHLGGRNVVFLDAHGKWYTAAAFWQMVPTRVLQLDPAFRSLTREQQEAARAGQQIPGKLPWK
jgi:prepilin-type N-terminal cleavage/methylation domain-containing protein/prepilin-type processing-associated H-X9-DG protein